MTTEQLIFNAADAAEKAQMLAEKLWREPPDGTADQALDAAVCEALNQEAIRLHCCALQLAEQAKGVPAPRTGE